MGVLCVPALAGDPRGGLVDAAAVVLPPAAETVGGVAGAMTLFRGHGWRGQTITRGERVWV